MNWESAPYFVVKWAVRDGVREAHARISGEKSRLRQLWDAVFPGEGPAEPEEGR